MKSLKTLIRIRKWELDEKRRALKIIQDKEAEIELKQAILEAELEAERTANIEEAAASFNFAAYANAAAKQQKNLTQKLKALEPKLAAAMEEIRTAFEELKKIEKTEENRKALEAEEQAKKEAEQMNEIALTQFRRREDAES